MIETVRIDVLDKDGVLFSLDFNTVEWADLLLFVQNGFTWHFESNWLNGIKQGIDAIKSGYYNNEHFVVKAYLV